MYSAVLMLALTAGTESVDFGRRNNCSNYGCSGYACSGYGYGCTGGSVGCSSGYVGCSSGYVGCSSGSYGCSSYGCSSNGHGRRGLFNRHGGCNGNHGCSSYGCSSGYYGCSGGVYGCNGGVWGCSGSVGCGGGVIVVPAGTAPKVMPKTEKIEAPGKEEAFAPATIILNVPATARVTVDGAPTTSTTARRTLITPALEVGVEYVYTIRAEVVENGQTLAQAQQVTVRGGQTSTVEFRLTPQGVASR